MPQLSEQDYFKALGLGEKAQEGNAAPAPDGNTPAAAEKPLGQDPADSGADAGASADAGGGYDDGYADDPDGLENLPVADDAGTADLSGDSQAPEDGAPDGNRKVKVEMTPEQRRKYAAERRQREQQEIITRAVNENLDRRVSEILAAERAQMDSEWSAFFKKAGLENPVTGKPIATKAEFDAWSKAESEAQMQRDIADGNFTPEMLHKAISENPVIKQAEERERQRNVEAMDARVQVELTEISKLDPSVKTLEDIMKLPTAPAFVDMVKVKGYNFLDAFKLANYDRLTAAKSARESAAAKQQALANAQSKDHLNAAAAARGGGSSTVPVPDNVKKMYRELHPKMTDDEIRNDYNKRHKPA